MRPQGSARVAMAPRSSAPAHGPHGSRGDLTRGGMRTAESSLWRREERERRRDRLASGARPREQELDVAEVPLHEPSLAGGEVVQERAQEALALPERERRVPAREEPLAPGPQGPRVVRSDLLHVEEAQVARARGGVEERGRGRDASAGE